jgi:hypothetical protein
MKSSKINVTEDLAQIRLAQIGVLWALASQFMGIKSGMEL